MKKILVLLLLMVLINNSFGDEAEKFITFEIHKRKIPLADYQMQIIVDTDNSWSGDNPKLISAGYVQNIFDNRIQESRSSYVEANLDTGNPLFEFKAEFTNFQIPIKFSELEGTGILISAYDSQGLLIAQSPYFPAEVDTVLDQDQVQSSIRSGSGVW